jgi:hypothetical protein
MGNGGEGEKRAQPAERRLVKDITVDKKDLWRPAHNNSQKE